MISRCGFYRSWIYCGWSFHGFILVLYRKKSIHNKTGGGWIGLCLLTLVVQMLLQFDNGNINLRTNEYGKSAILSFILACVAVFVYFSIFEKCAKNDSFGYMALLCKNFFLYLSSRSLIFMLFNELVIIILKAVLTDFFQPTSTVFILLCNSFVAVLTFIVLFVISELIRKTTLNNILA